MLFLYMVSRSRGGKGRSVDRCASSEGRTRCCDEVRVICSMVEIGRELLFFVVSRSRGDKGLSVDRCASSKGRTRCCDEV